MGAILKVWYQIENPTPSIDAYSYLLEEHPAMFHPDLAWNDGALGFSKRSPHTRIRTRRRTRWVTNTNDIKQKARSFYNAQWKTAISPTYSADSKVVCL